MNINCGSSATRREEEKMLVTNVVDIESKQKIPVQLRCTKCGVTQDAKCDCGAPYISASEYVAKYDDPGESANVVAERLGVSQMSVLRHRENSVATNVVTEKRRGKDGKNYPARKPKTLRVIGGDPATINQPARKSDEQKLAMRLDDYVVKHVMRLEQATMLDKKISKKEKSLIIKILHTSADRLLRLAQALDGR